MTRSTFGGTSDDLVLTRSFGMLKLSAATLTFWDAKTGGSRHTDLLLASAAVSSIPVADDGEIPVFQGPDGITEMWADTGAFRMKLLARDYVTDQELAAAIAGLGGGGGGGGPATSVATVINVKDLAYGAKGDGATDDTAAITAAITAAAASAGPAIVYFPRGVYMHSGLTVSASGLIFRGAGKTRSVLKTTTGATATKALNTSSRTDTVVEDLGFDANGNATMKSGVYANTSGTQKNLTVRNCKFTGFMPGDQTTTHAAIYTWTSDGINVLYSEFVGCGRGIVIDQPDGNVNIIGNRITATPGATAWVGTMCSGIRVSKSSTSSLSRVLIQGNYVSGATLDNSNVGSEGHGITVYRSQGVKIIGNTCENSGRGILVSYLSFATVVEGNTCAYNRDAGIRCEPMITGFDTTVGTDVPRGCTIVGNICHDNAAIGTPSGGNFGIGLEISYAAGSIAMGNLCYSNTHSGIHCDSDRVAVIGNVCHSNGKTNADGTNTGAQYAGIYFNSGVGCTIVGNQCFDNQTVKSQNYGLTLNSGGNHVVGQNNLAGNNLADINNVGRIYQGFFGAAPIAKPANPGTATGTDAAVINALTTALRNLGLIT